MLDFSSQVIQPTIRLLLAAILGGLIGWERERHDRPAGLRTHMLVCMGSALVAVISIHFDKAHGSDPSRIMSNIVTGIGFLGAGTIIRQGSVVRGLTTAASLWVVAAVGMTAGLGGLFYFLALFATIITYLTLTLVNRIEDSLLSKRQFREVVIETHSKGPILEAILTQLDPLGVTIRSLSREFFGDDGGRRLRVGIRIPAGVKIDEITRELSKLPELNRLEWE